MIKLRDHIDRWFLDKEEYFRFFAKNDTRLESWFKGELIVLLEKLRNRGLIENFERELKVNTSSGRKQIDFAIDINGVTHFCELKALCISQAKNTQRNLAFYFKEDHVGLIKDFRKLNLIQNNKWVIGFIYPNPNEHSWNNQITSLPAELSNWKCITRPQEYPDYLFIAFWRL
ncbi:MAG: hypothetical protein B5M53_06600 [Candidatus Cloacimonas sp. 4484_209]|nr:MAG: hypothetical protein B5M53_06600 [Candidatus Cloacimonas sp. 4484_209]